MASHLLRQYRLEARHPRQSVRTKRSRQLNPFHKSPTAGLLALKHKFRLARDMYIIAAGLSPGTPTMTAPNEIVARRLLKQAEWCERLGSSLYSTLLRHAAEDVRAGGVCCAALHDHHDDSPDSALALRFLGAVHRLV